MPSDHSHHHPFPSPFLTRFPKKSFSKNNTRQLFDSKILSGVKLEDIKIIYVNCKV